MATINVTLERLDDSFHFRASNPDGNTVDIDDATAREDGVGKGVGPMQLVVMALGGCSAVDIVSILRKSRQQIESFTIDVTGEKPDGVSPSLYERIHVHYALTGDLDAKRVRRAVDLSLNKYCSVAKTLEPTARITASFSVNGEQFDLP